MMFCFVKCFCQGAGTPSLFAKKFELVSFLLLLIVRHLFAEILVLGAVQLSTKGQTAGVGAIATSSSKSAVFTIRCFVGCLGSEPLIC
jgi:hypothetical protein